MLRTAKLLHGLGRTRPNQRSSSFSTTVVWKMRMTHHRKHIFELPPNWKMVITRKFISMDCGPCALQPCDQMTWWKSHDRGGDAWWRAMWSVFMWTIPLLG